MGDILRVFIDRATENYFGETLVELGISQAAQWTEHKKSSDNLLHAVRHLFGPKYGMRLSQCSSELLVEYRSSGESKIRPMHTCDKRWCPICQWRLSMRRWAAIVTALPAIVEANAPLSWLMLTLTVRNVPISDLRQTVRHVLQSWRRLTQIKAWPAVGWLRSVELTINPTTREAHPHIHALLAVKPSYFSGHSYISQSRWVELWQRALKADYPPIVDIRRVKPLSDPELAGLSQSVREAMGGVAEVAKYITKPADISRMPEDVVSAIEALRHVRMMEGGGILKGILSADEDEPESSDALDEVERRVCYWWRAHEAQYRRRIPPV